MNPFCPSLLQKLNTFSTDHCTLKYHHALTFWIRSQAECLSLTCPSLVFDTLCATCHGWPIHLNVIWIQTRGLWWEYHTLTNALFTKTVRFWFMSVVFILPLCPMTRVVHQSSASPPHYCHQLPLASTSLYWGKSLKISRLILCLCFWVEQAGSLRWFPGGVWGFLWSCSLLFLTVLVMPWFFTSPFIIYLYVGKTWLNT